jgi:hypothetical protein
MSVAGTWNLTVDTPMGKQYGRLELVENPDGTWQGTSLSKDTGEEAPLSDISVQGNEASWHQAVTKPMKLKLKCTVTVDGDKLTGKAKAGIFPAVSMTGERAAE